MSLQESHASEDQVEQQQMVEMPEDGDGLVPVKEEVKKERELNGLSVEELSPVWFFERDRMMSNQEADLTRPLRPLRQDGWTVEDDRILAEITLRHIAEGSTQTRAFEEAGDMLNRTAGACAFRWATVVKHEHQSAIDQAKRKSRELKKRRLSNRAFSHSHSQANRVLLEHDIEVDVDLIIRTLKSFKQREKAYHNISGEFYRLENEVINLKDENQKLRQNLQEMRQRSKQQEEDYKMLLQIVNRARKMTVREELESNVR